MKKIARLLAVVLAGVMLLSMTACSGESVVVDFNEDTARAVILEEINACRKADGRAPLVEYKELDDFATAFLEPFKEMSVTVLKADAEKCWNDYTDIFNYVIRKKWNVGAGNRGYIGYEDAEDKNGNYCFYLNCKYVSLDKLKNEIPKHSKAFNKDYNSIGIAFTEINGRIYWYAELADLEAK